MTEEQLGAAIRALFLAGGEMYGVLRRSAPTVESERAIAHWRTAVDAHITVDDPPPGFIPGPDPPSAN